MSEFEPARVAAALVAHHLAGQLPAMVELLEPLDPDQRLAVIGALVNLNATIMTAAFSVARDLGPRTPEEAAAEFARGMLLQLADVDEPPPNDEAGESRSRDW